MRIWLLGGFRIAVGSTTIEKCAWRLRKTAALVKVLALAPEHRLHREQVMELLWSGSGTKAASNNLRQVLYAARRALDPVSGPSYLASEDESLVLYPQGQLWVDVEAFEQSAAAARHARNPSAHEAALDLYAGELLPEDRYEEWAEGRREELNQLYLALLVEAAGLYEERHEYELAIEALRKLTAKEPTLDEAHAALMRIHALSGKPAQALSRYERLHSTFSGRLGTGPGATISGLQEEIAAGRLSSTQPVDPPPKELPDSGKHNLPVRRTSFVGRKREMVEIKRSLAMTDLLTLTGTGGCGKTRLALEVAGDLVGAYPQGVWIVELAPLSEGEAITQALATTLGVREQPGRSLLDTLLEALRDKEMLLILDNCEHLIDAAASLVGTLLKSCPRLRVLATSREPLEVRGELSWLVPSLSMPGSQQTPTVEDLEGYESARLFFDRASKKYPGFELTPENTQAVAQVCTKLEGIPLAIELAAARVGLLSAEQISERLEHPLKVLTRGERSADHRHKTLRATLDWSYELLGEPEQALFGRLSVFAGGFTLEAAESVGAGGSIGKEDVLDLLSGLVEKSLVAAEESWQNGARYRLLEPIRQYAREKLEESEEGEQTRYRHAEWYLALAEEADKESSGQGHGGWLERLETEHDNLRAALEWSLEGGDVELGLRLAGALWLFWFTRGYLTEGWGWLGKAIPLGGPPVGKAKALNGAGVITMFQGDFGTAKTLLEESLALYRELDDEEGMASSLNFLGDVAILGGRQDIPVAELLEEVMALKPRIKNRRTVANTLVFAGLVELGLRSDWDEAIALHEEALGLFREMEDKWGITVCLIDLGLMLAALEQHDRATDLLRELMHVSRELDDKLANQYSFFGLACVADTQGRTARAVRLWGVSEAIREAASIRVTPLASSVMRYESRLAGARDRLGEAAFEEAWAEGKAMTPGEAVRYALSEEESAPTTPAPEEPPSDEPMGKLTYREQEVALLIAQGLTNRQISTELGISERTAGNHVTRILRKLELQSRAQIATWTTEHRLLTPDPD